MSNDADDVFISRPSDKFREEITSQSGSDDNTSISAGNERKLERSLRGISFADLKQFVEKSTGGDAKLSYRSAVATKKFGEYSSGGRGGGAFVDAKQFDKALTSIELRRMRRDQAYDELTSTSEDEYTSSTSESSTSSEDEEDPAWSKLYEEAKQSNTEKSRRGFFGRAKDAIFPPDIP